MSNHYKSNMISARTIINIRNNLIKRLKQTYGIEDKSVADNILKVHGLYKDNFDIMSNVENRILTKLNLNETSVDSNANKSNNSIERVIQESELPIRKLIGYDLFYRTIKKLYGKPEAVRLSAEMYDYTIAMHDSTKIYVPYCWALSGTQFIEFGREYNDLKCAPAKHLHSYISMLCGTIHTLANSSLAGAIAVGTFFMDAAACLIKDGKTLDDVKHDKTIRKYINNMFQQFIYDVQDKTRSGVESPFTNVSIFDRPKLEKLLEDSWWVFEKYKVTRSEVVEMIIEIQEIYMDLFDAGDPLKDNLQFEFPVTTVNFSLNNEEERKIVDEEFLNSFVKHKVKRYNLFISLGSKVASCCRLINDQEAMNLASTVNSFGGGMNNLGSHRVCTPDWPRIAYMSESLDEFKERSLNIIKDCVKILKAHKQLIQDLTDSGLQPAISGGLILMNRMFSTLGIVGIYETVEILRNKVKFDGDLMKEVLVYINDNFIREGRLAGLIPNLEQIPAESMAVRMCEVTNMLLNKSDYVMYSNQTIPLWKQASLIERIREDGKYNKLLTGGGIIHAQIDDILTPDQIKFVINEMAKSGCEHCAINGVYSECENGHVIEKYYSEYCPKCHGKIKDYYTRVVGFLTRVSNWNTVRKTWEFPRRKFIKISNGD